MDSNLFCQIKQEKDNLEKIYNKEKSFLHPEVLKKSEQIDKLVVKLMRKEKIIPNS